MITTTQDKKLLTTRQVSDLLQVTTGTLAQWRSRGKGPPYHKIDKRIVRYDQAEIDLYLNAHRVLPEVGSP